MRTNKFRYTLRHSTTKLIVTVIYEYFEVFNGLCKFMLSDGRYRDYEVLANDSFTCLLDKNGKEIYEADKLKDSRGQIWIVSWNDNHACFMVTTEDNTCVSEVIDNENMEVIGNIHEQKVK